MAYAGMSMYVNLGRHGIVFISSLLNVHQNRMCCGAWMELLVQGLCSGSG